MVYGRMVVKAYSRIYIYIYIYIYNIYFIYIINIYIYIYIRDKLTKNIYVVTSYDNN